MSVLRANLYCMAKINGTVFFHTDPIEVHKAIARIIQELNTIEIQPRSISSIIIAFNKRPIGDGDEDDEFMQSLRLAAGESIQTIEDSDIVEGLGITWGEFSNLMDEPIWRNAFQLSKTRDRSIYAGAEIDSIKEQFKSKYESTGYLSLLWEKL